MYFIDLDGTILNTYRYHDEIVKLYYEILSKKYGDVAYKKFKPYFHEGLSKSEFDDAVDAEYQSSWPFYKYKIEALPGAKELLEFITENEDKPHILTGNQIDHTRLALTRLDLIKYVSGIFSMDGIHTKLLKSSPECYDFLTKQFAMPSKEMILIDNEPHYCKAAKEAGWTVFGVINPYSKFSKSDFYPYCDEVFDYTKDIVEFIQKKGVKNGVFD